MALNFTKHWTRGFAHTLIKKHRYFITIRYFEISGFLEYEVPNAKGSKAPRILSIDRIPRRVFMLFGQLDLSCDICGMSMPINSSGLSTWKFYGNRVHDLHIRPVKSFNFWTVLFLRILRLGCLRKFELWLWSPFDCDFSTFKDPYTLTTLTCSKDRNLWIRLVQSLMLDGPVNL